MVRLALTLNIQKERIFEFSWVVFLFVCLFLGFVKFCGKGTVIKKNNNNKTKEFALKQHATADHLKGTVATRQTREECLW